MPHGKGKAFKPRSPKHKTHRRSLEHSPPPPPAHSDAPQARSEHPESNGKGKTKAPDPGDPVQFRYELHIMHVKEPMIKYAMAPAEVIRSPRYDPEHYIQATNFINEVVYKYHDEAVQSHPNMKCWNCDKRATTLFHSSTAKLRNEPNPKVHDTALPCCVEDGECFQCARSVVLMSKGLYRPNVNCARLVLVD